MTRPDQLGATGFGPRLCGYFAFGSAARFAEKLAVAEGDFYDALNQQAAETALQAVTPAPWLDFGHVQTFFRSRRIVTTERAFNSLEIGEMHVRKRSASAAPRSRRIAPACCRRERTRTATTTTASTSTCRRWRSCMCSAG